MDLNGFKVRKGWTQDEMGEKVGVATSTVGGYCSGVRKPSYDVIERLFLNGATLAEVFSKEIQEVVLRNCAPASPVPPDILNNPDFQAGMEERFDEYLKKKGLL